MLGLEAAYQIPARLPCGHGLFSIIKPQDQAELTFCGLCWLQDAWETEIPNRFHEYKLLAENGNPETSPKFWAHLEANLGLIPPKHGQNLTAYRRSRARLYGEPSKRQFPVTAALYELMGYQPKLARPVVLTLCGAEEVYIRRVMAMTVFGVQEALGKGTRATLRIINA